MEFGPLEYFVVEFPGNEFHGEIAPALQKAVKAGTIRIIDLIFIHRDQDGTTTVLELDDLDAKTADLFVESIDDVTGMLSESDIESVKDLINPNSSALLLLFEHTWAKELRDSMVRAKGRLVGGGLVAQEDVDATVAWLDSESA